MIIRNTELAASREKFEEVEKRYKEVQANCSPPALIHKLQGETSPDIFHFVQFNFFFFFRKRPFLALQTYTLACGFGRADAANEADEESENLHRSFLAGEIELLQFIQKYRKQRLLYHRRSLIRMAALSSMTTPG